MKNHFFLIVLAAVLVLAACNDEPQSNKDATLPTNTEITPKIKEGVAADENNPVPKILQGADLAIGKRQFAKCRACHTTGKVGASRIGPNLYSVFGAQAASKPKFRFSKALRESGIIWDAQTLDKWIANPRQYVPGTTMAFVGVRDTEKRRALLAYLYAQTHDAIEEDN